MDRVAGVALGLVWFATVAHADRLRKSELRPTLKKIFPKLTDCYEREVARTPGIAGVVNTELAAVNDPKHGLTLTVTGFDTDGKLGESNTFRACVKSVFEAQTWPGTFATTPPNDNEKPLVERAARANRDGRYRDAIELATRGLKIVTMAGPLRRELIGTAGVAACHLKDASAARHFYALATPEFEPAIETSCQDAAIDLSK